MHKKTIFYPGKLSVVFCKGPLGLKDNPSLRDKSEPKREDVVQQKALSVISERGGDVTDALCWAITSFNLANTKESPSGGFWKIMWVTLCTSPKTNKKRRKPASASQRALAR